MPILTLDAQSYARNGSLRRSRGPANFGSSIVDQIPDAGSIPVDSAMLAKWQKAWLDTFSKAEASYTGKIKARVAEMPGQGYTAKEVASVAQMADPNYQYYGNAVVSEMALIGDYYNVTLDKVQSAADAMRNDPSMYSSNGASIGGAWNDFAARLIRLYQDWQQRQYSNSAMTQANTIMQQAQRAVAQTNLDMFGYILKNYKKYLSSSDIDFLNYYFLEWQTPKSDSDNARAQQIMTFLASKGYSWTPGKASADAIAQVQASTSDDAKAAQDKYIAYKQELDANGYIDPIKLAYIQSYESIQGSVASAKAGIMDTTNNTAQGTIVSNGGSQALTAADWAGAQQTQQATTAVNDATRISPLQTAFMTASQDIQSDVATLQTATQKNPNLLVYAGLAFLAYKLFRR